MEVLTEEVVTFLIMEQESCGYEAATDLALGQDQPLNTVYYEKWYELLPRVRVPSMADAEARAAYDLKVKDFLHNTPVTINFIDVPWPCDKSTKRKRIKDLVLFWHPDKFFPRFGSILSSKDREVITDLVLDISKELSRVLEEER